MTFSSTLDSIIEENHLSKEQAAEIISSIMSGEYTQAQTAGILTALRCKGETVDEIVGAAEAMRSHAVHVDTRQTGVMDTCGTGGDRRGTFNISTTSAFVVAGCGIPVAKHGNRSASSQCGSIDVLEKLGIQVELTPEVMGEQLDEIGMTILFARVCHPAMKHAAPVRTELGVRTIFNFLGPLTNPAKPSYQLVGISNEAFLETYAKCLQHLGIEHAWVVSAEDGLDEITLTGKTTVLDVTPESIEAKSIHPSDADLTTCSIQDLLGGTVEENAAISLAILSGDEKGPKRDAVLLNAGAAVYIAGKADTLKEGVQLARQSIDSKNALSILEKLKS